MACFVFYKEKEGSFLQRLKMGFFASTCSFMKIKISILLLNYQLSFDTFYFKFARLI